jgi:uncharacterized membrane protein YfcA
MTSYDPTSGLPVELPDELGPDDVRYTPAVDFKYSAAKAWVGMIVATIGAGATAGLAVLSTTDPMYLWWTAVAAAGTAGGTFLGVYQTRNTPVPVA